MSDCDSSCGCSCGSSCDYGGWDSNGDSDYSRSRSASKPIEISGASAIARSAILAIFYLLITFVLWQILLFSSDDFAVAILTAGVLIVGFLSLIALLYFFIIVIAALFGAKFTIQS